MAEILGPDEFPLEVVRTAYDRQGGSGDGYLVLTPQRIVVGDRPMLGEASYRDFRLDQVTRLTVQDEGFSRGTAVLEGPAGPLDSVVFSGFERARIDALAAQLADLKRTAASPPPVEAPAPRTAAPPPPPAPVPPPREDDWSQPMRPSRSPASAVEEKVPMAIVLADAPRTERPTRTQKGLYVHLDREVYRAGDTVRGRLLLHWPQSGPVRGVWWDVVGEETTRVSVQHGSGKNRRTVTYRDRQAILGGGLLVFGRRKSGFFSLVWEGMRAFFGLKTDNPTLRDGEYAYDFEFHLPKDAPPTWKGKNSEVRYAFSARVDIPGAFDLTVETPIAVAPPLHYTVEGFFDEHRPKKGLAGLFTAEVEMQVDVPPARFRPGEAIPFTARVKNLGGKRIRGLNVHLDRREHARAQGHTATNSRTEHTLRIPADRMSFDGSEMHFVLPTPEPFTLVQGRYCRVYWELRAELDVAWGFDAVVTETLGVTAAD